MRNISLLLCLLAAGLTCWCSGCGGAGGVSPAANRGTLSAPVLLEAGPCKSTSSTPAGIYVTWTRNSEPSAAGYYLYRDTQPIPMPLPEETLPAELRRNEGALIPQPSSGDHVTFADYGPVTVGETYFYRITVFDGYAESYPSNEMSWVVHGHNVTGLNPNSAVWGDAITIAGDTFGTYDEVTDKVLFAKVGGGEIEGIIVQPSDWTTTEIIATIPDLATTGPVSVVIDGIISQSDDTLTITSPRIEALSPPAGFLEQPLEIQGASFGSEKGSGQVTLAGHDVTAFVTSWNETSIELSVPIDATAGTVQVIQEGMSSNTVDFQIRPEILSAMPESAQAGEVIVLNGRLFGAEQGTLSLDETTTLTVDSWADGQISFTLAGDTGEHSLQLTNTTGLDSNEFAFIISPDLSVTMTGLTSSTVYRYDDDPIAIGVNTPADADSVELRLGETVLFESIEAPFADITLLITALTSGTHELYLRAYRRDITADSAPIQVMIYSLRGDLDGDGNVGQSDADLLPTVIGLETGLEGYFPWLDPDDDGSVTEQDLALIGFNWGNVLP